MENTGAVMCLPEQVKAGFRGESRQQNRVGRSCLRQLTHREDRMRFILAFFWLVFNSVLTTAWPFILFFISLAILHSAQDLSP